MLLSQRELEQELFFKNYNVYGKTGSVYNKGKIFPRRVYRMPKEVEEDAVVFVEVETDERYQRKIKYFMQEPF